MEFKQEIEKKFKSSSMRNFKFPLKQKSKSKKKSGKTPFEYNEEIRPESFHPKPTELSDDPDFNYEDVVPINS